MTAPKLTATAAPTAMTFDALPESIDAYRAHPDFGDGEGFDNVVARNSFINDDRRAALLQEHVRITKQPFFVRPDSLTCA